MFSWDDRKSKWILEEKNFLTSIQILERAKEADKDKSLCMLRNVRAVKKSPKQSLLSKENI